MKLRYVRSPIDPDEWMCWCGQLHETEQNAAGCVHQLPRLPGVPSEVPAAAAAADGAVSRARYGLLALALWVGAVFLLLLLPFAQDPAPPAGRYAPAPAATPGMNAGVMP